MFPLETDSTRVVAACSLILAGGTLTTVFDTVLDLIKNGVTKGQENAMKQFTRSLTQMLITCTPSWKLMLLKPRSWTRFNYVLKVCGVYKNWVTRWNAFLYIRTFIWTEAKRVRIACGGKECGGWHRASPSCRLPSASSHFASKRI